MTIEAWVYREDASRCETIVGHDYNTSYWFGFCNNLRFYRSGLAAATSSATVNAWQWTHVAVTYDGANARFYIDGALIDTVPLTNAGAGADRRLVLGANPATDGVSFNYPFLGSLDEVRIWSVVRTQQQIADNRYKEIRSAPGLVAAFATGGAYEELSETLGIMGSGTDERIRGILPRDLVVPKAAVRPTVDGRLYFDSEYLVAEELVIPYRAGPNEPDAVAWLVYTDTEPESLYVAIGTPRHNVPGWPYANTDFGLLLDPLYARNSAPQATDILLQTSLGNLDGASSTFAYGNGSWFSACGSCPPAGSWQVGKFPCGFEFDYVPCVEYRIDKSLLGSWSEFDGLALAHMNWGNGLSTMAPGDATASNPSSWVRVSYGDDSVDLPTVQIRGKVHAGLSTSSGGLGNWFVSMNAGGVSQTTFTEPDGTFTFNTVVPPGAEINVYAANCGFCKYATPTFTGPGIPGQVVHDLQVRFPACTGGHCDYQNANFFIRQGPGPITVTDITPKNPQPTLILRENPTMAMPATPNEVVLHGTNLHEFIKVSLSPVAPGLVCPCPDDWVLYDCPVVAVAGDGTWVRVKLPTVDRRTLLRQNGPFVDTFLFGWRFVVEDTWQRPNMVTYNLYPHMQASPNSFMLAEPDYPLVWGFGFINKDVTPGWREFSAVYGNNAYYCVFWDLEGDCTARIMDPVYAAFYPIYYLVGKAMTGSCAGMASTSLMFKQKYLTAEQFDPEVHYPAGFRQVDQNYETSWSRSEVEVLTWPASPRNLWARIRVGQMTQVSNEFLTDLIGQSCLEWEWSPFCGHADQAFTSISLQPIGYVAAMINSITGAHAVTPYATSPGVIRIYDNNYIHDTNDQILVNGNHFTYSNLNYSGSGLFRFPLSHWLQGRTAPIFGTADFLYKVVVGSADALVTTTDGKRWGWLADGTFVNEIPGSITATPTDGPYDGRSVPLLLPASEVDPRIQINADGGSYILHSGKDDVMLQLHGFDAAPGDTDTVDLGYSGSGLLEGFTFKPQRASSRFTPAVGMKPQPDTSALFRWKGLNLPAGQTAGFRAKPSEMAVAFTNGSGGQQNPYLLLDSVDGPTGQAAKVLFGPITVPGGAAQTSSILNWPQSTTIRSDVDLNNDGSVDQTSVIEGVVPHSLTTVGKAKLLPDGTLVSLNRVVATTGEDQFAGHFYCQDPGLSGAGIRVVATSGENADVEPGTMMEIIGTMSTSPWGERQIVSPFVFVTHDEDEPRPLFMTNAAVGGSALGSPPLGQAGVTGAASGLNTIGLLVQTTGLVTAVDAGAFTITDGSASVRVSRSALPFLGFEPGAKVKVTGICGFAQENGTHPRWLVPRGPEDVEVL